MLVNITNAEFVTSLGADIIMLNIFDVDHPVINGLPEVAPEDTIHEIKRLTGRMVAINLEPAAVREDGEKSVWSLTEGRRATVENAKMVIFDKKKCNFLSKKMLTNEMWFVIINELSQVSDNKPLQNEAKQNKKVVDKCR